MDFQNLGWGNKHKFVPNEKNLGLEKTDRKFCINHHKIQIKPGIELSITLCHEKHQSIKG